MDRDAGAVLGRKKQEGTADPKPTTITIVVKSGLATLEMLKEVMQ